MIDELKNFADQLKNAITGFVSTSPENYCELYQGPYFDAPLIGFARGDDPIFDEVKEQVGPLSWTPREALEGSLPPGKLQKKIKLEDISVVSWVLPIHSLVRATNRREKTQPSPEWSYTRNYGEEFNNSLKKFVTDWLEARGCPAVAPSLLPGFKIIKDPVRRNFTSTWSERHIAYACGLGTFSLNDGLITARGIAHRLGSVVVNTKLPRAERPYSGHMDYCLASRGCTACIRRCPVNALNSGGHDKELCNIMNYSGEEAARRRERLGFEQTGCGLCQVGVPCEDRIPARKSP
jgi:epoxyqueuosine reductase